MYVPFIFFHWHTNDMKGKRIITGYKQGGHSMDKRYMALGTSMLVLRLLEQESMYGYQIIRELEQQSRNVFQLQEGTLYPILHNLEEQGAVSSYRQTADSGRIRKYYAITPTGRLLLEEKAREWEIYQTAVNQVMGGVVFG